MNMLSPGELPQLLLAVSLLLATARLCGTLARRIGQPSVLGELAAGILLGPTLFGRFAPELCARLYPEAGGQASAFSVLTLVSIILFLTVAVALPFRSLALRLGVRHDIKASPHIAGARGDGRPQGEPRAWSARA